MSKIDSLIQEFHISVTPLGVGDEYWVRIERVAPGVTLAEERVKWDVEAWLTQAKQLMNDPLLGLLQGDFLLDDGGMLEDWETATAQTPPNLISLGQQLFNALFQGSLRDSWMMAQAIAQNQNACLRLRLGLKGTRLPRLPWEVLHAGDRPVATGADIAFSRYQMSSVSQRPTTRMGTPPNQPLKILMAIASPNDQEGLELKQEAIHLQDELLRRSPEGLPPIELTILEQPGREQLTQALEQGQYQVFHYAGHSNLGDSGGDVYLVSRKTGLTETLNGNDLAGLLVNNGIQLAVFNSCRGAYTAASDILISGERNLAEAVVNRGIPGVLAMAERIPDEVALTLTRLLYRNINQGYPIDLSLSRARQGLISAYGSHQLYWALPVLYLHPEFDGFLRGTLQDSDRLAEIIDLPIDPTEDEALFSAPVISNLTSGFLSDRHDVSEDEIDFLKESSTQDLNGEDPSFFIKDLLTQLKNEADTPPLVEELEIKETPNLPVAKITPVQPEPESRTKPKPFKQNIGIIFASMGAMAIALGGFWFYQNREPSPDDLLPKIEAITPETKAPQRVEESELAKADTSTVAAQAIENLSRGNLVRGQQAIAELLNRGALQPASAALSVVPKAQQDNPDLYFLKGRLAWQSVQTGNKDYSITDARRYWELAVKGQPKNFQYLNALGFAYYAEGNFNRANQAWFDALYLLEASPNPTTQDSLNTYAGMALGLQAAAKNQPSDKKASLTSKAAKLREKVITADPVNFQPDALTKNWLWTEKAIQDWRSLLSVN